MKYLISKSKSLEDIISFESIELDVLDIEHQIGARWWKKIILKHLDTSGVTYRPWYQNHYDKDIDPSVITFKENLSQKEINFYLIPITDETKEIFTKQK